MTQYNWMILFIWLVYWCVSVCVLHGLFEIYGVSILNTWPKICGMVWYGPTWMGWHLTSTRIVNPRSPDTTQRSGIMHEMLNCTLQIPVYPERQINFRRYILWCLHLSRRKNLRTLTLGHTPISETLSQVCHIYLFKKQLPQIFCKCSLYKLEYSRQWYWLLSHNWWGLVELFKHQKDLWFVSCSLENLQLILLVWLAVFWLLSVPTQLYRTLHVIHAWYTAVCIGVPYVKNTGRWRVV